MLSFLSVLVVINSVENVVRENLPNFSIIFSKYSILDIMDCNDMS